MGEYAIVYLPLLGESVSHTVVGEGWPDTCTVPWTQDGQGRFVAVCPHGEVRWMDQYDLWAVEER